MAIPPGFGSGQFASQLYRNMPIFSGATDTSDTEVADIDEGPGFVHQTGSGESSEGSSSSSRQLAPPSGAARTIVNRPPPTDEKRYAVTAPVGQDLERQGLAVEGEGEEARVVDVGAPPSELPADVGDELPLITSGSALDEQGRLAQDYRQFLQDRGVIPEGRPVLQSEIDPDEFPAEAAAKQQRLAEFRENIEGGSAAEMERLDPTMFEESGRGSQVAEELPEQWTGRGGWQYRFNANSVDAGGDGNPTITATDPSRRGAVFTIDVNEQAPAGGRYAGQNMWQRIWAEQIGLNNALTGDGPAITEDMSTSQYEDVMRQIMESRGQTYVPIGSGRRSRDPEWEGDVPQPTIEPPTSMSDISGLVEELDQEIYNDAYTHSDAVPLLNMLEEADSDPESEVTMPEALMDIPGDTLSRLFGAAGFSGRRDTQIAIANEIENRFSDGNTEGITGSLSDFAIGDPQGQSPVESVPEPVDAAQQSDAPVIHNRGERPVGRTAWAGDAVSDLTQWYSAPWGGNRYMGGPDDALPLSDLLDGMSRDDLHSWLRSSRDPETFIERANVLGEGVREGVWSGEELGLGLSDILAGAMRNHYVRLGGDEAIERINEGVLGPLDAAGIPTAADDPIRYGFAEGREAVLPPTPTASDFRPPELPPPPTASDFQAPDFPVSETEPDVEPFSDPGFDVVSETDEFPVSDPDNPPESGTSPFESPTPIVQGSSEIGAQPTPAGVAAGMVQSKIDDIFSGRKTLATLNESELNVLLRQFGPQRPEERALIEARLAELRR